MQHLGFEEVTLDELRRFPGNARVHDKPLLRRSTKRLGQLGVLVVRVLEDGSKVILAGNGTADALQANGNDKVRIELVECTDDEARRANVVLNQSSDKATNDPDLLGVILAQMEDTSDLGFTEKELNRFLGIEEMPEEGDADTDELGARWGVIIECSTEDDQVKLLEELATRGLNVRAIVT